MAAIIEKLQRMSAKIFRETIKTYTLKDITLHQRVTCSNLVQNLSRFPNQGVGFKVRRNTWPIGKYYIIKSANFKAVRYGTFYGNQYFNNKLRSKFPVRMQGCRKRNVWDYQLGQFEQIVLDNGMKYTRADIQPYYQKVRPRKLKKHQQSVEQQKAQNQEQGEAQQQAK